jgi:hypothetical protein
MEQASRSDGAPHAKIKLLFHLLYVTAIQHCFWRTGSHRDKTSPLVERHRPKLRPVRNQVNFPAGGITNCSHVVNSRIGSFGLI